MMKKEGLEKWYKDEKTDFGEITQYYKIKREISRGGYGVVYKALELDENGNEIKNNKVAVKCLYGTNHDYITLSELHFLKLLEGKYNTLLLKDAYFTKGHYYFVTEYFKHKPFEV